MKKYILMMGAASLVALTSMAHADTKHPVAKWTCEDFLGIDEKFKPTAVGLGEAINKSGKVEDAVLDVDGVATITPLVITACKQTPNENFVEKLKTDWTKFKADAKKDV